MGDRLEIVSAERIRDELDKLLVGDHAPAGLELLVETGLADRFLPEVPALRLEQDPVHRHKDVLRHTYAVVERCEPDGVLRLAALLHDIGKPATRKITPEGVTFHHHEMEGARMARARLTALRYPNATIDDVCTLIELHLRFHGYGEGEGWTDAAVRRYVRDAGPLLDKLNQLTRADVTTRNERRAEAFAKLQDDLEARIAALAEEENLEAIRPPLDGRQVMELLDLPARPRRRRGARLPDGAADGARADPRGRGDRAAARLGGRAHGLTQRSAAPSRNGSTAQTTPSARQARRRGRRLRIRATRNPAIAARTHPDGEHEAGVAPAASSARTRSSRTPPRSRGTTQPRRTGRSRAVDGPAPTRVAPFPRGVVCLGATSGTSAAVRWSITAA